MTWKLIDPKLKKLFPTLLDLYYYLANFIGDSSKVDVNEKEMLVRKDEVEVVIDYKELQLLEE